MESLCLETIDLSLDAALESKFKKLPFLNAARIKIEILKRLFRIAHEMEIINRKIYINLESDLQEISRMANGWIKYLNN